MNFKNIHNTLLLIMVTMIALLGLSQKDQKKIEYLSKRNQNKNLDHYYDNKKKNFPLVVILDTGVNDQVLSKHTRKISSIKESKIKENYDYHGHGTMVASLIKTKSKNNNIKAIKIFNYNLDSHVKKKFIEAVRMKPKILVCAFAGQDDFLEKNYEILKEAEKNKTIIISAAGNSSINTNFTKIYPASYPFKNIISVMSVNRYGERSQFSNYGSDIFIGAIGENLETINHLNSYKRFNGTSASTAYVAGVVSAMLSINPNLSVHQIKRILRISSKFKQKLKRYNKVSGIVDEDKALELAYTSKELLN